MGTRRSRPLPSMPRLTTHPDIMTQSSPAAPLVVVDCRPETEEVLKAVFEPRGVIVSRPLHARRYEAAPWLVIRGNDEHYRAMHVQFIEEHKSASDHDAGLPCHELRLPPLFHYGDLIRSVERLLNERHAA